jgi:hypothetical protein
MPGRFVAEVEVDPRRRVSLGKAGHPEHTRYRVEEDEVGVLTLTPVVSVPITLLDERLRKAIAEAKSGQVVSRRTSSTGR